jgi:parvulin-like peptidyl-prolyl isomerase
LYQQGLQNQLKKQVQAKATEDAVRKSYNEIQVRHVLIKSGEGGLPEEQAKAKAQKILDTALKDPAQLAKLARENSDDPGSKDKGGFYDWAPAGRYVPGVQRGGAVGEARAGRP